MTKFKKVLIFLVIILLTGCFTIKKEKVYSHDEILAQVTDYIEKKYNREFELSGSNFADYWTPGRDLFWFYPKDEVMDDDTNVFLVKRVKDNGKIKITDGYIGYKFLPRYLEISTGIIKKYFTNVTGQMPYIIQNTLPRYLNVNSTFDEFKEYTDNIEYIGHILYIGYDGSTEELDNKIQALFIDLQKAYTLGSVDMHVYPNEYFKKILSGEINIEEVDKDRNCIKSFSEIWGERNNDYPQD